MELVPSDVRSEKASRSARARLGMTLEPLLWLHCSISGRARPGLAGLRPRRPLAPQDVPNFTRIELDPEVETSVVMELVPSEVRSEKE